MILSHRYRCIFVHIPKTAGTSITEAFREIAGTSDLIISGPGQHIRGRDILAKFPDEAASYRWFTAVRNPWDLVHSDWRFCQRMQTELSDEDEPDPPFHEKVKRVAGYESFAEFAWHEYLAPWQHTYWPYYCQADDGRDLVTHTLRFERIEEDWRRVCEQLGLPLVSLPHLNGATRREFRLDYTDELRGNVGRKYEYEINRFGYTFDEQPTIP